MFSVDPVGTADKAEFFRQLDLQANALMGDETDYIANAANLSALIFQLVDELNWVGFYFLRSGSELVLGPFQGRPACVRIGVGKGVCGMAVVNQETIVVADVHAFPRPYSLRRRIAFGTGRSAVERWSDFWRS